MNNGIYINFLETVLLFFSLTLIFFIALKNLKSYKNSTLITILLILPLFLSIEGTTQFLKTGMNQFYLEAIYIDQSNMAQWYKTALRITDTVIGTLISMFKNMTYIGTTMDLTELKMLAKALHWLLGFLLIVAIYQLINKHYITENQQTSFFIIYFYAILLLPTNIYALKMFNYDLLSMLLGALAIVLLIIAIEKENDKYAFWGIIIATLASQEKVIAGPIVFLACMVFTYLKLIKLKEVSYVKSFYYSLYSIFIAFVTILTTFLIVALIARREEGMIIDFVSIFAPIIRHWGIIIRTIGGGYHGAYKDYTIIHNLTLLLTIILVALIPLTLIKMKSWLRNLAIPVAERNLRFITIITMVLVFFIGILGTYSVKAFLHPFYPILDEYYFPPYSTKNIPITTLHFGVKTFPEHITSYIGYAYALFINAIPTIYLALFTFIFWHKQIQNKYLIWELILLLTLSVPLFYAITATIVAARYFNLFILLMILVVVLKLTKILASYSQLSKSLIVTTFIIGLTMEIFPFRPVVGYFRPIWSNCCYSETFKKQHTVADGGVGWELGGRNEEVMLIGKKITKMIESGQIPEKKVNIYHILGGEWLDNSKHIVEIFPLTEYKLARGMTKSDYLVIGRTAIAFGLTELPQNVEPFLTISNYGYVRAWVYRGDQLVGRRVVLNTFEKDDKEKDKKESLQKF